MNFSYWMVLVAALLPYVAFGLSRSGGAGDPHAPRLFSEALTGWCKRAEWAHRNGLETFAPFAAAVVIANLAHAAPDWLNGLAAGFVAARILHIVFYTTDKPPLRSAMFGIGMICTVGLFVAAANA